MSHPFQPSPEDRRIRWLRVRAKYKWRNRLRRDGCVVKVTLPKELLFTSYNGLLIVELADGNILRMKMPGGQTLLETPLL